MKGTVITSDRTPHSARLVNGSLHYWEVSYLPGRRMDYENARTAIAIADRAGPEHTHDELRTWVHREIWADSLGLTAHRLQLKARLEHLTAHSPNGTVSMARRPLNVNASLPLEVWVLSPDMHESAAVNELGVGQNRGDIPFALVEAVLALASAVNRLAEAHESLAEAVGDLTPPRPGRR
jgi:hypothetical protein